jgi:hypothetical protein
VKEYFSTLLPLPDPFFPFAFVADMRQTIIEFIQCMTKFKLGS